MMSPISPYTVVSVLAETGQGVLLNCLRRADNTPVWIKLPKSSPKSPKDLAAVQHEYEILQQLAVPGVVQAVGLEREGDRLALVLEDFGGLPLSALPTPPGALPTERRLDVQTALWIAAAVCEALVAVHARGIVHQRISPAAIVVDLKIRKVGLVDFACAVKLAKDARFQLLQLDAPGSALPYLAPEQTGRIDRTIDHRSDLYAVGATLYELLTGTAPYVARDATELVHSIIARVPVPPRELVPDIPARVSALVLKLLAKSAEDRYQSASGLGADLQTCIAALAAAADVPDFPLDQHALGTLRIPQKLYGRAAPTAALAAAWGRARAGAAELVLLLGKPGTGKSALLRELRGAVARDSGYFIASRFAPDDRLAPYTGLARAFQGLIAQRLAEGPDSQARLRQDLSDALGVNAELLIDILPELGPVLGARSSPPPLGPLESQNRLKLALRSFLRVFSTEAHPTVLCLDDAQWADPASIELVKLFLTDIERGHLLVLCAFQSDPDELADGPQRALAAVEQAHVAVSRLAMDALALPDIKQLLADTLACSLERAEPLAEILLADTAGLPLSLHQRLEALREEGLFRFDPQLRSFCWELTRIEQAIGAVDVTALLSAKLQRLPVGTQRVLALAACSGGSFSLATVAALYQHSELDTLRSLDAALGAGLVVARHAEGPLPAIGDGALDAADPQPQPARGRSYLFVDERVQQAASALLPAAEQTAIHHRLSQILAERGHGSTSDQSLFELVRHDLLAAPLLTQRAERLAVAERLLLAGQRAKARTAYQTAASYLAAGAALDAEQWADAPQLGFSLLVERAECEHLAGQFAPAEVLFRLADARAPSLLQRVEVAALRVVLHTMQGNIADAVAAGRGGLALLGMDLPLSPDAMEREIAVGQKEIADTLAGRAVASLLAAPQMTEAKHQAALRLLLNLQVPALLTHPRLRAVVVLLHVRLSLRYGHCALSAYGYMAYATILARALQQYRQAHEWGTLALRLNEHYQSAELTCKLHHLFGAFLHFLRPLREALSHFERSIQAGLLAGDFQYVGFAACQSVAGRICVGDEVRGCLDQVERMHALMLRTGDLVGQPFMQIARQALKALSGATESPLSLSDDALSESTLAAGLEHPGLVIGAAFYHVIKLQLLFLHGRRDAALAEALLVVKIGASSEGMYFATELSFFLCLILAAHPTAQSDAAMRALLSDHRARVKLWAQACPDNYGHKESLIAAELARVAGDDLLAMRMYDEAIASARRNDFVRDAALASELAAQFHFTRGREFISRAYLTEAHREYLRWGATAKARALTQAAEPGEMSWAAPHFGAASPPGHAAAGPANPPEAPGDALDIAAIVHATQTIVEEIELEKVLARAMRIIMANAGAQRGLLMLEQDGRLRVEAVLAMEPAAPGTAGAGEANSTLSVGPLGPVEDYRQLPQSIVAHVVRTREPVVLGDAVRAVRFVTDPYVAAAQPRSVLCLPLLSHGELAGVLYLENRVTRDVFSPGRIELLRTFCLLLSIALKNARLYENVQAITRELQRANEGLEQAVLRRTDELSAANTQLAAALHDSARNQREQAALREAVIAAQRERLAELAAPLIPIAKDIMVMPLIGKMDDERARQVLETALHGAHAYRTRFMILDITGMTAPDAGVANVLLRMTRALGLLGTHVAITGVRPEVARAFIGLDAGALTTQRTLESGIAYARQRLSGAAADPR